MKTTFAVLAIATGLAACTTIEPSPPTRMTFEELNNFQINCSVYQQQVSFLQSQKHSIFDQFLSMHSMSGLNGQQHLSRSGTLNHNYRVSNGDYNRMIDHVTSRVIAKCANTSKP